MALCIHSFVKKLYNLHITIMSVYELKYVARFLVITGTMHPEIFWASDTVLKHLVKQVKTGLTETYEYLFSKNPNFISSLAQGLHSSSAVLWFEIFCHIAPSLNHWATTTPQPLPSHYSLHIIHNVSSITTTMVRRKTRRCLCCCRFPSKSVVDALTFLIM